MNEQASQTPEAGPFVAEELPAKVAAPTRGIGRFVCAFVISSVFIGVMLEVFVPQGAVSDVTRFRIMASAYIIAGCIAYIDRKQFLKRQ